MSPQQMITMDHIRSPYHNRVSKPYWRMDKNPPAGSCMKNNKLLLFNCHTQWETSHKQRPKRCPGNSDRSASPLVIGVILQDNCSNKVSLTA